MDNLVCRAVSRNFIPGSSECKFTKLYYAYIEPELIRESRNSYYIWSTPMERWIDVVSQEAATEICNVLSINAPVNFAKALSCYLPFLVKSYTSSVRVMQSVCVGKSRYSLTKSEGSYTLKEVQDLVSIRETLPRHIGAFCVSPVDVNLAPEIYRNGESEVSRYLKPLFPNPLDLACLQWIIGNSMLDPVTQHKILILSGPGGSGKSTTVNTIASCFRGTCRQIDCTVLTSKTLTSVPDRVVPSLVSSRLCTAGDVNFTDGYVNTQVLKILTGNDLISHPDYSSIGIVAKSSIIFSSNHLPDPVRNMEWQGPAILRRVVVIPMEADARSLEYAEEPTTERNILEFTLESCVRCLESGNAMPISSKGLLTTMLGCLVGEVEEYITFDDDASYAVSCIATSMLCEYMEKPREEVIRMASEITPYSVHGGILGYAIKGIVPMHMLPSF